MKVVTNLQELKRNTPKRPQHRVAILSSRGITGRVCGSVWLRVLSRCGHAMCGGGCGRAAKAPLGLHLLVPASLTSHCHLCDSPSGVPCSGTCCTVCPGSASDYQESMWTPLPQPHAPLGAEL